MIGGLVVADWTAVSLPPLQTDLLVDHELMIVLVG